jgi:uncharacterized protein (DUF3820 family)
MSLKYSIAVDQALKDGWIEWDKVNARGPRPDLEMPWSKACSSCKGTKLTYIQKILANGAIQFRHICADCGTKSEPLPFARDVESLGATVLPFGKHKGKTLQEIETAAPDYLDWYLANGDNVKLLGTIVLFRRLSSAPPVVVEAPNRRVIIGMRR